MLDRRNGTIRNQRLPKDLLDSTFQIDGRSLWDHIGYLVAFLSKVNYFNLDNEREGHWDQLVASDPIIQMVLIINSSTKPLDKLLDDSDFIGTSKISSEEIIEALIIWYYTIEKWHANLNKFGTHPIGIKIENTVRDVLSSRLEFLTDFKETPEAIIELRNTIHTFKMLILHIQNFTKDYLKTNLFFQKTHLPHNAMYIAFVQLYQFVQDKLNTISRRHLDFYYKEVLQQKPRKAQSTRATLIVELLPTVTNALIPKETLVAADKMFGSKEDIVFKTQSPLVAHQIEITRLQTLFFNSSPYVDLGTSEPLISSAIVNDLVLDGKIEEDVHNWFVFGANKQSIQNTQIDAFQTAHLGFIIGSPVLALDEGHRSIHFQLNVFEDVEEKSIWCLIEEIAQHKQITKEQAFSLVFDKGFVISYSSEAGWIPFDNYLISNENNVISISCSLQKSDLALSTMPNTIEQLQWPSVKFVLNEYAPVYLYSFLKKLKLSSIKIDVEVKDLRDVVLYNNVGKIPLGKPFEAFGPTPSKGSYIMIGKSELFQKGLDSVAIQLHWENLPDENCGLDAYYDGYSTEITNQSFQVQIYALTNSYWVPTEEKQAPKLSLFETEEYVSPEGYKGVRLCNENALVIPSFKEFDTSLDFSIKEPLKYEVNTSSGFLKVELVAPSFAFGNDVYQEDLAEIMIYNARNNRQVPFPNKPLVPKLKGISLDYKASDRILFDENHSADIKSEKNLGQFIHIRPSGRDYLVSDQKVKDKLLVPNFSAQGYLFIGLKGVLESKNITIFFHFLRSGTTVQIGENKICWEFYYMDQWIPFSDEEILNDGTGGLTKTGIIELSLPVIKEEIAPDPDSTYWIRAATKHSAQHYPKIKGIYLNAVQVTCTSNDLLVKGKMLDALSIHKLMVKNPSIKRVYQPAATYGGIGSEQEEDYYSRVSERIRHKSRALTVWDYERLVLANFDNVLVVKCTNLDERFHQQSGAVKVVVLSKNWTNDERYYFKRASLDSIKEFLEERANPFCQIEVINPIAEYLLVNVVVAFIREDRGGYYIEELNQEISNYLSPIQKTEHDTGGIGGSVVPNSLLRYIENLPYVDRIGKLSIEHIVGNKIRKYSLNEYQGGAVIRTTKPWAMLMPVQKHHIISKEVGQPLPENILKVGIENMEIGQDFILEEARTLFPSLKMGPTQKKGNNDAIFSFSNKSEKS